jgi:salicylate hydroxylase
MILSVPRILIISAGAGAGCAIEDVNLLSGLLAGSLIKSPADIKYTFRAYDALRRPRSQELVRRSREQGHWLELESQLPGLSDGNKDLWQKYLKTNIELNAGWVWNVNLESMLVEAKELVKRLKE